MSYGDVQSSLSSQRGFCCLNMTRAESGNWSGSLEIGCNEAAFNLLFIFHNKLFFSLVYLLFILLGHNIFIK